MRPIVRAAASLLLVVGLAACQQAPATAAASKEARLDTTTVTIESAKGKHRFTAEVARTPAQQERGLMFRTALPPMGGMIFLFKQPKPASFWMHNTPLPLDIIFIRADGTIARIAAQATPYSLDFIESGEPVTAVLEIAGGEAARLGISEGDRVRW